MCFMYLLKRPKVPHRSFPALTSKETVQCSKALLTQQVAQRELHTALCSGATHRNLQACCPCLIHQSQHTRTSWHLTRTGKQMRQGAAAAAAAAAAATSPDCSQQPTTAASALCRAYQTVSKARCRSNSMCTVQKFRTTGVKTQC